MNSEEWEDVNMRGEALRRRVVTEEEAVAQSPGKAAVIEAEPGEKPQAQGKGVVIYAESVGEHMKKKKTLASMEFRTRDLGDSFKNSGDISEKRDLQDSPFLADLMRQDLWDNDDTARRASEAQKIQAEEWKMMERKREMAWKKWNEEDVKANEERWLDRYAIQASKFRDHWMAEWSRYGSFEATTEVKPMRFTDEPAPHHAAPCDTLQVFSVKVAGIRGGLLWPLDVFGLVAVRDCIDQKRNIIFHRERADSQTLTEEDPYLVLTGPTRAVLALRPVTIEVELKVKGSTKSEDKDFSALAVPIESGGTRYPRLLDWDYTSKLSTLEFTLGHIVHSVEATIFVQVVDGSWPDGSRFQFAARAISSSKKHTDSIDDEEIILLDCLGERLPDHGNVNLSRCVASVEVTGQLVVCVKVWFVARIVLGKESSVPNKAEGSYLLKDEDHTPLRGYSHEESEVVFKAKEADKSDDILDLGFCTMKVTVAWSLILREELSSCY